MNYNLNLFQSFKRFNIACFVIFTINIYSLYGQSIKNTPFDSTSVKELYIIDKQDQINLPFPFFTNIGLPLNVGTFSIKAAALPTQDDGKTKMQYNFQLETGVTKTVGLVFSGKALFYDPTVEESMQFPVIDVLAKFLAFKSDNGLNGFSPFIEFEFPWSNEQTHNVYTLVGFAAMLSNKHFSFNQDIHYNPLENLEKGSISLILKVSKRIFLVAEFSGLAQKEARPIFNLLGGVKIKLYNDFVLGFAYRLPITDNRDYTSQYIFQPDFLFQNWLSK
jgi:hypothetical protein